MKGRMNTTMKIIQVMNNKINHNKEIQMKNLKIMMSYKMNYS